MERDLIGPFTIEADSLGLHPEIKLRLLIAQDHLATAQRALRHSYAFGPDEPFDALRWLSLASTQIAAAVDRIKAHQAAAAKARAEGCKRHPSGAHMQPLFGPWDGRCTECGEPCTNPVTGNHYTAAELAARDAGG